MLTRDQIKAAKDRPREWVPIAEWTPEGETYDPFKHGVYVGMMSARDRDNWELHLVKTKTTNEAANLDNARAMLAVLTVQHEDGSRMFTDADAGWLGDKASVPLAEIFNAALRVNKLRAADTDELVKN